MSDEKEPKIEFIKKPLESVKKTPASARSKKKREDSRMNELDQDVRKKIDAELAEIYKDKDGQLPDMTHFEKRKRSRFIRALFVLVLSCGVLGAVAWAGFFVLSPASGFSQEKIIFSISGEEQSTIGAEVHYRVRYRNDQSTPLSHVVLQVRYPNGFVFRESNVPPSSEQRDTWQIPKLGAFESAYIDIYGTLYGSVDQEQSLRAFLTYVPENFSSEFQSIATLQVKMVGSPVSLKVDLPADILSGAESNITVTVIPQEGKTIDHIALVLDPGTTFLLKKSEPAADQFEDHRWSLGALNAEKKITLRGVFSPPSGDEVQPLVVRLVGWPSDDKKDVVFTYDEELFTPNIVETSVVARAVINGSGEKISVRPGEVLHTSVVVQNNGEVALKDVRVRAVFDAPSFQGKSMLNWAKLDDPKDGAIVGEQINPELRRGSITWSSREVSQLSQLVPHGQHEITFQLPVKNSEEITLADLKTQTITGHVEMTYRVEGESEPHVFSSQPMTITVNSDLSFEIRDDVGSTSSGQQLHAITWILSNSFHELEDVRVSASVYGQTNVPTSSFVVSAGSATYDAKDQKLLWTVDTMPLTVDILPFQFSVIRTDSNPSQTQLVSKVEVHATDAVTKEELILLGDEVLLSP